MANPPTGFLNDLFIARASHFYVIHIFWHSRPLEKDEFIPVNMQWEGKYIHKSARLRHEIHETCDSVKFYFIKKLNFLMLAVGF